MPIDPEIQRQQEERTIEGRTFDQWREEYEKVATPMQARETAGHLFGEGADVVDVTNAPADESEPKRGA